MRGLNFFASFGDTPLNLKRRAPKLGEQTDAILQEMGRSEQEVRSLREAKIVR
jgi:crotonobetainyl-CoA:carnitine CoA-transferase CaiB-like acyl-CoA transferase